MLKQETFHNQLLVETLWNRLIQPASRSKFSQDYLLILAAIDNGWQIREPVSVIQTNKNFIQCAYLIDLYHENGNRKAQIILPTSSILEQFLCEEGIAIIVDPA